MVAIVNNHQFTGINSQSKATPATKEYKGVEQHPSAFGIPHKPVMAKDAVQVSAEGRFVAAVAEFEKSVLQLRQEERARAKARNSVVMPFFVDDDSASQSFEVTVTQLATAQVLESSKFADDNAKFGSGTLTFECADGAFSVPVRGGLQELAEAINHAEDNCGVIAALYTDEEGVRLVLRSDRTGTDGAFTVTADARATESATPSLRQFCFNGGNGGGLCQTRPAQNAEYAVDGRRYTAQSNLVEHRGISFELVERGVTIVDVTPSPVQSRDKFIATLKFTLRRALDEVANIGPQGHSLHHLITELRDRLQLEVNDVSGLLESGILKQKGNRIALDILALRETLAPVMRAAVQANGELATSAAVAESASLKKLLADQLSQMADRHHDNNAQAGHSTASTHGVTTSTEARAKHYFDIHKGKS